MDNIAMGKHFLHMVGKRSDPPSWATKPDGSIDEALAALSLHDHNERLKVPLPADQ